MNERERKRKKMKVEGSQLIFFSEHFWSETPFAPVDVTIQPRHHPPTNLYPKAAGSGMDGAPQGFFPRVRVCLFLWTACPLKKRKRENILRAHTLKQKGVNKMGLSGSGKGNSSSSWLDIPPFPMEWTHFSFFFFFFLYF